MKSLLNKMKRSSFNKVKFSIREVDTVDNVPVMAGLYEIKAKYKGKDVVVKWCNPYLYDWLEDDCHGKNVHRSIYGLIKNHPYNF